MASGGHTARIAKFNARGRRRALAVPNNLSERHCTLGLPHLIAESKNGKRDTTKGLTEDDEPGARDPVIPEEEEEEEEEGDMEARQTLTYGTSHTFNSIPRVS